MQRTIFLALSIVFGVTSILHANPADISPNNKVDLGDFAVFAAAWLSDDSPTPNWNPACDISDPNDGIIDELDLAILAANWLWTPLDDIVWVAINNDPGVSGHEGFNGYMSKYETTNAQYCQYLNAAMADGQIIIYNDDVHAASDTSHSQIYLELYPGSSPYSQITFNGTTFSVRTRKDTSNNDIDMSNHPVVMVSWYGATAFCNYYGYRLPTEWEWQAVADYDGSYTYGCGTTIDHSKANYDYANPLNLSSQPYTSPVDYFDSYGYGMNDMAGNSWEWTSSIFSSSYRVLRGGGWYSYDHNCTVSYWNNNLPNVTTNYIGFRVCR